MRVALERSDGSRVIGIGADHETACVEMANGDTLTGVPNLRPIGLATVFGKASIAIAA